MTDRSVDRQDRPDRRRPSAPRPIPVPPRGPHPPIRRLDSFDLHAGRVIDQRARPEPQPEPDSDADGDETSEGWLTRRRVIAGLAGTGLAGATIYIAKRLTAGDSPPRPQPRTQSPSAAGGFADRDQSFTSSVKGPLPPPQQSTLYASASEAAAATQVVVPTILATDDPVLHLLRRTSFGPTPALVDEVHTMGIDAWLAQQLDPMALPDDMADGVWAQFPLASMAPGAIRSSIPRYKWDAMADYGRATLARQIWSRRQLYEVMVDFWANHLNVTMPSGPAWDTGVSYHNDVIRRHALGSFTDMLLAAMRHPAMLRYLSNAMSTKSSVNENLGRELLELHTVGIGSGYTEDDVRNSAYILTGRTAATDRGPVEDGTFIYDPTKHWTGPVKVLDFQDANASAEGGLDVGDAYLRYLAAHPATAQTIARKLVVRLVSDDPPPTLVDRLATAFQDSGTAILPVLDIMFRSGEFWAAVGQKTRRPLESVTATTRILDVRPGNNTPDAVDTLYWIAQKMGHRPLAWRAPDGYPDVAPAWSSASALLESWNLHRGLLGNWYDGLSEVRVEDLAPAESRGTVGEYIDGLCRRICFQTFQAPHRDALIAFVGADAATPTGQSNMAGMLAHVSPLVMDAPYLALR